MSIQVLNPSPVMTGTDYVFSSTYAYSHMPQVAKELTQRFGDQDFFRSVFELIDGGVAPVAGIQYNHLEDNWLTTIIKVNAASAGSANASATLTIQSGYLLNVPLTTPVAPYLGTAQTQTNPVQLNMTLDILGVQCQVVAVTATTFDVVPKVSGEAIPAVTTDTEIIIVGNSWGERTGQPESMAWRPVLYTNNMQEIKGTFSVSAREMQMEAWIDYPVLGGGTKKLLWSWNALKNYQFYRNQIATTLITGKKTTNAVLSNTANPGTNPGFSNNQSLMSTEGMVPFVQNYGNTYTYSGLTGLQKADWSTITTTYIDKYRGAKEYMALSGIFARNDMSNWMGDSMKNGAINYGMFGGGTMGKEKAINYDFDSFQLNGYTFHMKTFDPFNYIQQLGAAGQPYPYRIILIPADRVAATMGDGPRVNVPAARVVYLKHAQAPGAEYMVEWATGAAGGAWTSQIAEFNQYYRSTVGFEGFAGNRWVIIDKQ